MEEEDNDEGRTFFLVLFLFHFHVTEMSHSHQPSHLVEATTPYLREHLLSCAPRIQLIGIYHSKRQILRRAGGTEVEVPPPNCRALALFMEHPYYVA